MKTLKKIVLVSLILGGLFTSIPFTQGNDSAKDLSFFGLGDRLSAGNDAVMGDNLNYQLQGVCTYYNSFIVWRTNGDGVFDNPYNLHSVYTPGVQDRNSGSVILSVDLMQRGIYQRPISDSMTLSCPY